MSRPKPMLERIIKRIATVHGLGTRIRKGDDLWKMPVTVNKVWAVWHM